jgi:lysine 6-dehydrogenase
MMRTRYAVLGAGRQGTAAAYDLARFGRASVVYLADVDLARAESAAARINSLLPKALAEPSRLDAADSRGVARWLAEHEIHVFISAVPYYYNLDLTRAAIQAGCGMTDLGGNSDIVLQQLELDPQAKAAGVAIVPDCGQVPGMGTSLILYAMEQLDEPREVYMWDCGLPQHPEPPWNYRLTFAIEGLTNEYYGDCLFIRDGKTTHVPALEEYELLEFPDPIGQLEAFTTSGGLTTAARTFAGRLQVLQNKTLRYPGHFAQLKVMQHLGLFELEPIEVDGQRVIPRHVLHALWDPQIRADPQTRDFILVHILVRGVKDGRQAQTRLTMVHYYDEETGFTAMEQGTGWHAAILTEAIAMGEVPKGVIPIEKAMRGSEFVARAAERGFKVQVETQFL